MSGSAFHSMVVDAVKAAASGRSKPALSIILIIIELGPAASAKAKPDMPDMPDMPEKKVRSFGGVDGMRAPVFGRLHACVVRSAAAFRCDPDDVLRWVFDIAGLAMHTVLRIDLQAV